MTLDADEFIRRFLIHVLPSGFQRIRYFGFLGNCHRARNLALCRELLGPPAAMSRKPERSLGGQLSWTSPLARASVRTRSRFSTAKTWVTHVPLSLARYLLLDAKDQRARTPWDRIRR
jgi:hypothetical protein